MFVVSIFINIGMWFERFVIIVTSLHRDFLPSSWGNFSPTIVDICIYAGSLGLFFTLFLLFIRWIPMIAMAEVKGVLPDAQPHHAPRRRARRAPRRGRVSGGMRRPKHHVVALNTKLPRRRARRCSSPSSTRPDALHARRREGARRRLQEVGRAHAVSRSTAWTRPWASATRSSAGSCSSWPHRSRRCALALMHLGERHRLPDHHRRQAARSRSPR